jgi:predicted O-linked N-acetylglucosamine transferase (SPINDLY family)
VLVDLRGYAHGQRAAVLALRPAPVQVQLVGYPGTMAAPFIDYLIADAEVARDAADFTEALVTLPGSYLATDDRQEIAAPPTRAECALPDGAFVYCCFNTNYKIEPLIFGAWMEILHAVPHAVLWLIRSNDAAERNLRHAATAAGIDPARLIFAPRRPKAQHLARHAHADVFLDTHFVNAHTTAVDALWAGLPVLTWPGRSFVARVGASVAAAAGLDEMIASDRESYVAMAVALGRDPEAARALKARLAAARGAPGGLFDTRGYSRLLEAAYTNMWRRHAQGSAPASFSVSA